MLQEECEDNNGVIRILKSKKDRQHNGLQNTTQKRLSNTNTTKTRGDLRCSGKVSSSCSTSWHSSYKASDKSWRRKGPGSVYDKWNISIVICDTDIT